MPNNLSPQDIEAIKVKAKWVRENSCQRLQSYRHSTLSTLSTFFLLAHSYEERLDEDNTAFVRGVQVGIAGTLCIVMGGLYYFKKTAVRNDFKLFDEDEIIEYLNAHPEEYDDINTELTEHIRLCEAQNERLTKSLDFIRPLHYSTNMLLSWNVYGNIGAVVSGAVSAGFELAEIGKEWAWLQPRQ